MLSHELLCHGGTHRVTKEHDRYSRIFSSDMTIEHPQVIQAQPPAISLNKEAKLIFICASPAVAAMIVGVNGKACVRERPCQASVSSGMLCQAMSNLYYGFRFTSRQPPIDK